MKHAKLWVIVAAVTSTAALCNGQNKHDDSVATAVAQGFSLDASRLNSDLAELTKAPHPFGSPRQAQLIDWLEGDLKASGVTTRREPFTANVPNPSALSANGPVATTLIKSGTNLYAIGALKADAPCVVALATHFDTKEVAGFDYLGANDSASSTAVLLAQLKYLRGLNTEAKKDLRCDIVGVFFDGEEAVLPNWSDGETIHPAHTQDNTYGSRYAAGRLTDCSFAGKSAKCLPGDLAGAAKQPLVALLLMDMIGSPDLQISRDANSTPALVQLAASGAALLGLHYDSAANGVEDDHSPFRKLAIPALDLIDFNHLDYWHRPGDEAKTLALASMQQAGRLALYIAAAVSAHPDQI